MCLPCKAERIILGMAKLKCIDFFFKLFTSISQSDKDADIWAARDGIFFICPFQYIATSDIYLSVVWFLFSERTY